MKPRIYADTSVVGGCFDDEFRVESEGLFADFMAGRATLVISDLTLLELTSAPDEVRAVLAAVPRGHREEVELTAEAAALAQRYIQEGAIGLAHLVDAQHIAIATIERVDVLVSWNFKHVVNLQRIRAYNAVNLRAGYPLLEIRTPREVWPHGDEED